MKKDEVVSFFFSIWILCKKKWCINNCVYVYQNMKEMLIFNCYNLSIKIIIWMNNLVINVVCLKNFINQ